MRGKCEVENLAHKSAMISLEFLESQPTRACHHVNSWQGKKYEKKTKIQKVVLPLVACGVRGLREKVICPSSVMGYKRML